MLQNQINKDYVAAMKAKDKIRSSALGFLRAQLKNVMIDSKADALDDAQVLQVLKKQVKQRKDSIEQFQNGGRQDLVDKEKAELDLLLGYMPVEMSDEALEQIIQEVMREIEAKSLKDMGRVMKEVITRTEGQADNKRVSEYVKKALAK